MRSKTWIRRMVGPSCWVGVFLVLLAPVLVSFSFANRRV